MTVLELMGISIALAMDAFAVATATGISLKIVSFRQTFRLAWHFGLFQAMMTVVGWTAGMSIRTLIEAWDHWIAFALLLCVGGNMIRSAIFGDDENAVASDPTRGSSLVLLSVATSIDALAVGLGLSIIHISIAFPAVIIGITACVFTISGLFIGAKAGSVKGLSRYAEILGGAVLIGIGLNILHEHGAFHIF